MTEHDIVTAVRDHWIASWAPPAHEEPYVWNDDAIPGDLDTLSLRVSVRSEGGERVGAGRAREENRGLIAVEVSAPRKNGPGPGERCASQVAAVWRAFRHERIKLSAPSVVGLPADGAFNRHLITLGWRGDMRFAQ